jgi:hypothetical protein
MDAKANIPTTPAPTYRRRASCFFEGKEKARLAPGFFVLLNTSACD